MTSPAPPAVDDGDLVDGGAIIDNEASFDDGAIIDNEASFDSETTLVSTAIINNEAPLTVMAVDAEPDSLTFLTRSLEHCQVLTFSDPSEALAAIARQPVDVVICEQRMVDTTGLQFFNKVSALAPGTIRILLTGYRDLVAAASAVNEGKVNAYLRKPVDTDELRLTIARAMRLQTLYREHENLATTLAERSEQLDKAQKLLDLDLDKRSSELLSANNRLEELARKDGLTGLYNHRYFQERIARSLSAARRHNYPLSLLFGDVDWFKSYNDRNGHPAGDTLLRRLASMLVDVEKSPVSGPRSQALGTRSEDVVARYGGEEFVILLPHTGRGGALTVAERLRTAVESHNFAFRESQPLGAVTMSFGVAEFPADAHSQSSLIRHADEALLHAKRHGRNRVVSYAEMKGERRASSAPPRRLTPTPALPMLMSNAASGENQRLRRQLERERAVRKELETMLENRTRGLYLELETVRRREARLLAMETEKFALLGRLSAGIAHEFGHALEVIKGGLQDLSQHHRTLSQALTTARQLTADHPETAVELAAAEKRLQVHSALGQTPRLLRSMEAGANRITSLLGDLGGFSSPHAALEMSATDLRDTVEMALSLTSSQLQDRKIIRKYGPVMPVPCHADRIGQAIVNLLLNAADATKRHTGVIEVGVTELAIGAQIEVTDNGCGIPEEHLTRLFEPFFTTKPPGSGTGLGLFVARQIVAEHGGQLRAEARANRGASFYLVLPPRTPKS